MAIEIEHLRKRFGDVTAVDDVSLSIASGELLVLLGGSGSGKTTLLRMVNRLIEPSEGHVRIGGEDTSRMPPHELRRRIGYCFQRIGLFPHLTVAENVGITPELRGWPPKRVAERVDECLRLAELDPARFRERRPHELSGGEQQRAGLARALAGEPDVVLLDEPFGALDAITRERLQSSFDDLRRRLRLTAIFVTHDVLEAFRLADRIGVMDRGRLLQVGRPDELVEKPVDDRVAALVDAPRRQAAEVERILAARRDEGAGRP
jgi:osmoprotectant transport system ATP-binding protein